MGLDLVVMELVAMVLVQEGMGQDLEDMELVQVDMVPDLEATEAEALVLVVLGQKG